MLTRRLGSILRGRATRLQVMLACTLGGALGFVPGFFLPSDLAGGFAQAPGLILLLLSVALIANVNLAVFSLTTVVAKLLSLPLLAVSYTVGTWLLDGPLQGLFGWLCNFPVTAWFGLEHYATSGGLVLGVLFGGALGWLINRVLRGFRAHMVGVESSSERYRKMAGRWWVKLLAWAFLGSGKGKKTWQEVAEQASKDRPFRLLGVGLALLLCIGALAFQRWLSTPLLTRGLQSALAAGNGATVDLQAASVHLGSGVVQIEGLAVADRGRLDRDLVAADELTMSIDISQLLRRRFVIDSVKAVGARAGTRRDSPGVLLPGAEPEPEPQPAPSDVPTIEDYLEEYQLWKQRLAQVRKWVEVVFEEDPIEAPSAEEEARDRQERIEIAGFAGVVAEHLLVKAPRVLIRKIDIEGMTWSHGDATDLLTLRLRNVSSAPELTDAPSTVSLGTASGKFALHFAGPDAEQAGIGVALSCHGIAVDRLFSILRISGQSPLRGGTLDLECGGRLSRSDGGAMTVDLPFSATLHDTTITAPGGSTRLDELVLPAELYGDVTRPSIRFDGKALRHALVTIGKRELAQLIEQHSGGLLGELGGGLSDLVDPEKRPAVLDAAKKKVEEAGEKAKEALVDKARNQLEKVLPGLGGQLGGKKKKE